MRSRPRSALPTELPEREVLRAGLEPATTSSWTRTGAVPARSDPQCAGGIRTRVPELPQAREDGRSSTALRDSRFTTGKSVAENALVALSEIRQRRPAS